MSDDRSARLALPYLYPGQAQKETTHNEALALLDLAVQAAVVAVGVDAPPDDPAIGACWIIGANPSGAWSDNADAIAGWTAGGWRFVVPREGMAAWSIADGAAAQFVSGGWRVGAVAGRRIVVDGLQVVGAQQPAIPAPAGGAVADTEARAAIGAILGAMRAHGLLAP